MKTLSIFIVVNLTLGNSLVVGPGVAGGAVEHFGQK